MPRGSSVREKAILVGMSVTVTLLCSCEKRRAFDEVLSASQRWFVAAWGTEFTAEHRAREEQRLECMWSGLEARGVEPATDFECLAGRTSMAADCHTSAAPDAARECTERAWASGCQHSAAFEELAAELCAAPKPAGR